MGGRIFWAWGTAREAKSFWDLSTLAKKGFFWASASYTLSMAGSWAFRTSSGVLRILTPCFFSSSSTALLSWSTLYAVMRMISAMPAHFTIAWRSLGSASHFALLISTSW